MSSDVTGWRKSSYSGGQGGNCIEVAARREGDRVLVRDTRQHGTGPVLRFSPAAWRRFADRVKRSLALDPIRVCRCFVGALSCFTRVPLNCVKGLMPRRQRHKPASSWPTMIKWRSSWDRAGRGPASVFLGRGCGGARSAC